MKTPSQLTCLIAGLGSIGRRHLRNLRALGVRDFVLYRRNVGDETQVDDELIDLIVESDLQAALAHRPDVAVIANPTALHLKTALACARAGVHLFIEKPLAHSWQGCEELMAEVRRRKLVVMTGFQFRFHPGLWQIKNLLAENSIGPVVSAQAHWGEYLPAWHPWEDHRLSYSARADLGGGVVLTLCHPFDYLRWLLGDVCAVSALISRRGGLDIGVEDTASIQLLFASGTLAHVHLDYVERPPSHWLQINGQRGTLQWNNQDGKARLYDISSDTWRDYHAPHDFERNQMFVDEMAHFLSCVREGKEPLCSLSDGAAALRIALAAKESAREEAMVSVR